MDVLKQWWGTYVSRDLVKVGSVVKVATYRPKVQGEILVCVHSTTLGGNHKICSGPSNENGSPPMV